jgi:hypothetical protein
MNRIARLSLCLLAAFAARPAFAQDALVVAGAGVAGKWDTEFDLANVSTDPIDVMLFIEGLPLGLPCPPNCTSQTYALPGAGTRRVLASDFIGTAYVGPQIVRVETLNDAPLPIVHARSVSSESACQFAELPVVRESAIEAADSAVLVFPGVARSDGVYTNLILESLTASTSVEVELRDADGVLLGTDTFTIPGEATFSAFTLVDVGAHFGVATLENGQARVRNLTATGPVWGVLATVGTSGSLRVAVGANP